MDSLPVELLRLIYEFCEPASVRTLRLGDCRLAEVGYEFLIPPLFQLLPWRDDVRRLHNIAGHDRLRGSIESVVLDFSDYLYRDLDEHKAKLYDLWCRSSQAAGAGKQQLAREDVPSFDSQSELVHEIFSRLPNLRDLRFTFTGGPSKMVCSLESLRPLWWVPDQRKIDREQVCADLNVLISAVANTASLSSLEIDRLPLEIFKVPHHRQHWFECGPALSRLSRLAITVDPAKIVMPQAQFRAMNGLGRFLHFARNLRHLTLAFHNAASPRDTFALWFNALFDEDFRFDQLEDLRLEGVSCDEDDLKTFLARHGPSLRRLHLGGIHLCRGTFKSLFTSLRGKLPMLESVHLHGQFECGMRDSHSYERYYFRGGSSGTGTPTSSTGSWAEDSPDLNHYRAPTSIKPGAIDSYEFERYLLSGGVYPGSSTPPSPQSD